MALTHGEAIKQLLQIEKKWGDIPVYMFGHWLDPAESCERAECLNETITECVEFLKLDSPDSRILLASDESRTEFLEVDQLVVLHHDGNPPVYAAFELNIFIPYYVNEKPTPKKTLLLPRPIEATIAADTWAEANPERLKKVLAQAQARLNYGDQPDDFVFHFDFTASRKRWRLEATVANGCVVAAHLGTLAEMQATKTKPKPLPSGVEVVDGQTRLAPVFWQRGCQCRK